MRNDKFFYLIFLLCVTATLVWGGDSHGQATGPNPNVNYNLPNFANSPLPTVVTDPTTGAITSLTGGMRKFVDSLPGLTAAGVNNLGQFIPVAKPNTTQFAGSDYYEIELVEYTEKMHSDLPPTKLRGYRQTNISPVPAPHYLGPIIVATKDRPVRIKFTNRLPVGAAGDLFIPTDVTIMGAGVGPDGVSPYKQNRATLHLHGGNTPWISDGTPHQWTVPAGETTPYKKGLSTQNVPDMPVPANGSMTFYYTNQQSGRLMFYHDHAYGITRLNVYAGEAAGYLLQDKPGTGEWTLPIPADQIPLIVQDKTYVPDAAQLAATDPLWDTAKYGGKGNLWFPHVYMPNQDPNAFDGSNPMGRWDYGPWFWPVFPVSFALPTLSAVPEAFSDTPVINGTAYPYVNVQPKAYRFRILNACNDRMLNLQLYVADPAVTTFDGRTNTEVKMVDAVPRLNCTAARVTNCTCTAVYSPAGCFPATWPTDGRWGGVPDPATAGPPMVQIGTEGGLLPAPALVPSQPVNYEYNRRSVTVLNVSDHALFIGPAERADVVIDFSKFAGKTLILYNDAPAPVPAYDTRLDYYTDDFDQTAAGGAPTTVAGFGPNTRTMMQIRVAAGTPGPDYVATTLPALTTAMASSFAANQEPPIVAQSVYGPAYGKTFTNTYAHIYDGTLNYPNFNFTDVNGVAQSIPIQNKAIQELFDDYGRMNAILGTELPATSALVQTTIPLKYIDPPTETFKDGETQIWKITHNGVDTHAIHFHLFNAQLINRIGWDGMIKPPSPNEQGWKETIRMNPLEDIVVAVKAKSQTLPFSIPDSVRPLDVTMPVGSTGQFTGVDPFTNNPITVTNVMTNFGWEYVWHCHLLGHEENDMMRPMVMYVPPPAPTNLIAAYVGTTSDIISWKDNSKNETGFYIERSTNGGATWTRIATVAANVIGYRNAPLTSKTTYKYRVQAFNANSVSGYSNVLTITTL